MTLFYNLVFYCFLLSSLSCSVPRTAAENSLNLEAGLRKLLAESKPGDTVFIPAGVYNLSKPIIISSSGTKTAWITIMPKPGEEVVFDGSNYLSSITPDTDKRDVYGFGLITVKGAAFVRLKNIKVQNSHAVGILVTGKTTSHIELIKCKTEKSYNSGIGLWYADSCKVLNCEVVGANYMELIPAGLKRPSEAPHEAISVAGATNFQVAYNSVHDSYKEGIDVKEVSAYGVVHDNKIYNMPRQGMYVDSWFGRLHHVEFRNNEVYNCQWGMAISAEDKDSSMDSIFIHHNLLYNNRGSGVLFGVWGENEKRSHVYVYNNTIVNNGSAKHWAGLTGGIDIRSSNLSNVFIYNNISAFNYGFAIGSSVATAEVAEIFQQKNIIVIHNLEWQTITPGSEKSTVKIFPALNPFSGQSSIKADPSFTNKTAGNFSLLSNSPAINTAWKEAPVGKASYLGAVEK